MKGAAERTAAARSHERFRIQVTSNFREADSIPPPRDAASTALILLFREEVFSSLRLKKVRDQRSRLQLSSKEVETGKYSGFWLPRVGRRASSFPPSPSNHLEDWPWEIVSSHSSATAPESHGIPHAAPQPQL